MHLVVLRLNGFQLPDELPQQLQPFTPLIDLSDGPTTDNWANFQATTDSPKQFTVAQPIADNHRIVAPVAVRLSPPAPPTAAIPQTTTIPKPPPPPPRAPGRTGSLDITQQPILPPRTGLHDTPQRNNNNNNPSTSTTPYFYNRTQPAIPTTSQQPSDPNIILEQIRDLLKPDHLQELSSIISTSPTTNEQVDTTLTQLKARNAILKAHLKHWEDQLTDLIDKRISLEHQIKFQQQ